VWTSGFRQIRPGFSFSSIPSDLPLGAEVARKTNLAPLMAKQLERHSGAKMATAPVTAASPKFVGLLGEFSEQGHSQTRVVASAALRRRELKSAPR
jgi:hypothetical protein